ncbi:MAG: hypothetical protein B7Y99_04990 [Caulobacterales bacterium 32-69-10]|nr:MAG: hypothetical protein B7Y99_04990 [Caulobacterales bacterium 32-69-10]
MRTAHPIASLHRLAGAAAFALLAATSASAAVATAPPLAPGVELAKDLTPSTTQYVVTNTTPVYRAAQYDPAQQTGLTVERGERLQTLGETTMGAFLLIGRNGTGVGYVPRSLVCPVNLCTDVQG